MSPLPKNLAAKAALNDEGLLSGDQVKDRVKMEVESVREEAKLRNDMWIKIASAKTPKDYKDLIDSSLDVPCLLELLEADGARSGILLSTRLSTTHYYKLQKLIADEGSDLRTLIMSLIDDRYNKVDVDPENE
ncbi:hypothetical protein NPN16_22260 [Vibrio parahaemolyticus]|uniref:hypothetical protein n=1 Tax=Vibrio parahaemolyticus TaxID=670 RepID=UPI002110F6D3|nr:hypothetical protein [Vibrio parahaemolyticus]MCQ4503047.1 hypothetical protein [Vibrio parahaemolyticus]MCQ6458150.1 hypothetical protein [Vibrio parahaemolyticus]MCQ6463132.1 hypothetical protein [Vibrio parahaemolyticus]MCQ6467979.1 hypothetical protein [Vibrio parahaemolyticus]MCQ6473055.1 hypothetical protein [Vibrio parahaemolyticus]